MSNSYNIQRFILLTLSKLTHCIHVTPICEQQHVGGRQARPMCASSTFPDVPEGNNKGHVDLSDVMETNREAWVRNFLLLQVDGFLLQKTLEVLQAHGFAATFSPWPLMPALLDLVRAIMLRPWPVMEVVAGTCRHDHCMGRCKFTLAPYGEGNVWYRAHSAESTHLQTV